MAALLPLIFFALVLAVCRRLPATRGWRESFVAAAIIWGVTVVLITELLGGGASLQRPFFLAAYLIISLVVALLVLRRPVSLPAGDWAALRSWPRFELGLLAFMMLIVLGLAVLAWISPPNNWDAMTYHMSRVAHWIQGGRLANYPSHNLRQLNSTPWAEYAILQFQLLSGTDRWANLVQWFGLVGSLVAVSLVAAELGAGRRGQLLAAAFCLSLPMIVLQATSTQNDLVAAFWVTATVYYLLRLSRGRQYLPALAAAAALGLALLTKATAYVFLLPFLIWFVTAFLYRRRFSAAPYLVLIAALVLVLNAGYYRRNLSLFGNPLGPSSLGQGVVFRYANDLFTPAALASNVMRNLALHAGTGRPVDVTLTRTVMTAHAWLGLDPEDPRTTWPGTTFLVPPPSYNEDQAGNPLQLGLILLIGPGLIWRRRCHDRAGLYFLCLGAAFLFFCFYLRWQPWHSRLHLPLFVLAAPPVGVALARPRRGRALVDLAALGLLLAVLPWLLYNPARPVLGSDNVLTSRRADDYFRHRPDLSQPYQLAAQQIAAADCSRYGLKLGDDDWEYPLWVLAGEAAGQPVAFTHVHVNNVSGWLPAAAANDELCGLLLIGPAPAEVVVGAERFQRAWVMAPLALYQPLLNDH